MLYDITLSYERHTVTAIAAIDLPITVSATL